MFWVNDPSTVSPITADNLARAERFLLATAGADGDYYVTIPNGVNLALNDRISISFPVATDDTKDTRISIDGGTTWKNVKTNINVVASAIESQKITFQYDGTYWVPTMPIRGYGTNLEWVQYPDGRAEVNIQGATLTMSIPDAFGSLYRYISSGTNGVGVTMPGVFSASPAVYASLQSSSPTKAAPHGYPTGAGPYVAHMQYLSTATNAGTTSQVADLRAVGKWK